VRGVFHRGNAGQSVHAMLRGRTRAHPARPRQRSDRGRVADRATAAPLDQRQLIFHTKEHAFEVNAQDLIEVHGRVVFDTMRAAGDGS
jgi:hypothetical protein